MNVADLIGLVALLTKTVDTLRYTAGRNLNGLITQLVAWGIGVGGVFLVAQTQWASHITIGSGGTLARQGALSLVAIGLAVSSSGGVLNDFRSVFDNTNTAVIPPLAAKYVTGARGVLDQASAINVPGAIQRVEPSVIGALEGILRHLKGGGTVAAAGAVVPPDPADTRSAT